jgi:predicted bacteriocin transport accessory protein
MDVNEATNATFAEGEIGENSGVRREKGQISWKSPIPVILAIALLLALGAGIWLFVDRQRLSAQIETLETTYSEGYLHLNSVTIPRFEEMVASGDEFLISISRPNCPFCRAIDPDFVNLVEELNMTEEIYYVNVASIHDDSSIWLPFKEKYGFFYTPAFMHYQDGKIVSYIDDEIDAAKLREWLINNRAALAS